MEDGSVWLQLGQLALRLRTPHYISAAGGGLLGFAGLWDQWKSAEGEEIVSATIITRAADAFMAKINTRMPSMLLPADFDARLSGAAGKDMLCKTLPQLEEWIASTQVNKTGQGDDDPATIAPVSGNPARL